MELNAENLINDYLKWIKDNTHIFDLPQSGHTKIVTPFLDSSNDHIQIYISRVEQEGFLLTDDGLTMAHLSMKGVDVNTPRRKRILSEIVRSHSADYNQDSGEITVRATRTNFAQKKHSLVQALLELANMSQLSTDNVTSIFKEEVSDFLTLEKVPYIADVNIVGKSSFQHHIDFAIPSGQNEYLVKTLTRPKKDLVMNSLFVFSDIKEQRRNSQNVIIYNDQVDGASLSQESKQALDEYGVMAVTWSQRQEFASRVRV